MLFMDTNAPRLQDAVHLRLSIKWYICDNGKEGSVRETQEGCPSPLKSVVFEAFSKFQKLRQRGEMTFSTRCNAPRLQGAVHFLRGSS